MNFLNILDGLQSILDISIISVRLLLLSNSSIVSCLFQSNGINWKFCMSNNVIKLTPSTSKHGLEHLVWHKNEMVFLTFFKIVKKITIVAKID